MSVRINSNKIERFNKVIKAVMDFGLYVDKEFLVAANGDVSACINNNGEANEDISGYILMRESGDVMLFLDDDVPWECSRSFEISADSIKNALSAWMNDNGFIFIGWDKPS